ncbi:MAG: hypothetical protein MUC85_10265 [Anaerolineales bacterium]|nr:hypothetical protein [Anaerolineales bacterium]
MKNNRFQSFAPAILKVYRRDKEAFWAAVMAPFMSETTFLSLWQHRKVTADLFFAFQGLDDLRVPGGVDGGIGSDGLPDPV